jgi:hypothetical protein
MEAIQVSAFANRLAESDIKDEDVYMNDTPENFYEDDMRRWRFEMPVEQKIVHLDALMENDSIDAYTKTIVRLSREFYAINGHREHCYDRFVSVCFRVGGLRSFTQIECMWQEVKSVLRGNLFISGFA